jgi:hypothetical protein
MDFGRRFCETPIEVQGRRLKQTPYNLLSLPEIARSTYCSIRRRSSAAPTNVITAPADMMIRSGA